MSEIIYQGNVRVYLQGKNALFPISSDVSSNGQISYHIGDPITGLVLCDHRPETVAEARSILLTRYQNGFAKHFNQCAAAEVQYDKDTQRVTIDLYSIPEITQDRLMEEYPVLWMGTLENNIMPGYKVEWEIFRKANSAQTAFVALIS